jgi:RNA polymerase sigma-70 factor (ECF subfamily)
VTQQSRQRVLEMLASAEKRWPTIKLGRDTFVQHVTALVGDDVAALDKLHGDDLYLACACLDGNAAAAAIFDVEFLQRVQLPQMRAAASSDLDDEIRQRLRERVLAGKAKLRGYSGKGPLHAWLRVAATRLALDLEADAKRRQRVDRDAEVRARAPEEQLLEQRYRRPVEAAFANAFAALDDDERALLKQHYIDGVSLLDIGRARGFDRSTASRRVAAARERLLDAVKREVGERLKLTPRSVSTLVEALKSRLEITLKGLRS